MYVIVRNSHKHCQIISKGNKIEKVVKYQRLEVLED